MAKDRKRRSGSSSELRDEKAGTENVSRSNPSYVELPNGLALANGVTYIGASDGGGPMDWHGP